MALLKIEQSSVEPLKVGQLANESQKATKSKLKIQIFFTQYLVIPIFLASAKLCDLHRQRKFISSSRPPRAKGTR